MALEVKLIEPPKYGTVAWNGVKWVYTPNTNYPENTTDSWLYALNVDGVVSKGITEYYNPKNQVPFSVNPLFLVDPRSKYTISVRDLVVDDYISLANLKILYISTPKNGKITINDNQDSFTYEANNALDALDELSYTVTDGQYLTEGVLKIKYVSPVFLGSKITDYVAYLKSIVDRFAIVPPTSGNWNAATTAISSISAEWLTLNTEKYNAAFDYVEANDAFLITSYQKDPIYSGLTSLIETYSASWDSVRVDASNLEALISPLTAVWQSNTLLLNEKYFSWNDNIPLYNRLDTLYSSNTSKYDNVYAFINTLSSTFDPTAFSNTYGSLSSKWEDVTNTVTTKRKDFGFDVFQTRKYDSFVNTVSTLSSTIPALNTLTTTKNAYWASNSSISSISARALSGAGTQNVVSRNLDVYNDLIIRNNLRVLGPKTQIDTTLNTLCSFEIKNTGTIDAVTVDKTGLGNILRLGNTLYVKSFGKVGINIDPTLDSETLTIVGNISASGKIYPDTIGDQMTLYKSVSSRYENTFTYFTANSATFNTIRLSLPYYDNAYDYVRTNSGDISRLLAPDYSAFDAFTKSFSGGSVLGLTLTGGNYLSGAGDIVDFKNKDFTVEAWIKMPTLPTSTTNLYNVSSYTLVGSNGISFVIGATQMFCTNGATSLGTVVHGMSANRWHHVAYVRNTTTQLVEYYVDGIRKGTAALANTVSIATSPKTVIGAFDPPTLANTRYFKGAISNLKITNGQALYTTNFTPNPNKFLNDSFIETVPLYYNDVSLLLSGEEPPIIDNSLSGRTLVTGSGVFTDTLSAKFGDQSLYFNGTNTSFLNVVYDTTLDFSGQFCLEFWFWSGTNTGEKGIFAKGGGTGAWNNASGHEVVLFLMNNNFIARYNSTGQANGVTLSGTNSNVIIVNDWNHCAFTFDGTTYRAYLNGSIIGSSTSSLALPTTRNGFRFGNLFNASYFLGYINGVRYTKGSARYTTPTIDLNSIESTYSNLNGVTLLINQRNSLADPNAKNNILIKDFSNRKNQFTLWGQPVVSKNKPYIGAGNSIYFDSTSNITIKDSATDQALDFSGVGDWTIDFWVNFNKLGSHQSLLGGNGGGSGHNSILIHNASSNVFGFYIQSSATWDITNGGTNILISPVETNRWYHSILTRRGNKIYQYLNGKLVNVINSGLSIAKRTVDLVVGSRADRTEQFQGYLCDLRFIKGKSLYSPYTYYKTATAASFKDKIDYNVSSVSLLTLQDTNFLDSSILNNTLTAVGVMAYEPTIIATPRLSAISNMVYSTLTNISSNIGKDPIFIKDKVVLDQAYDYITKYSASGLDNVNYFYQFNNLSTSTVIGFIDIPKKCVINSISVFSDVPTSLQVAILSCIRNVSNFPDQTINLANTNLGASEIVLNNEIKKVDNILNNWNKFLNDFTNLKIELKSNTTAKDVTVVINTTKLT